MASGRLLLVLPLRVYDVCGRFFIENQACNGLRLWLENFDYVTLALPSETATSVPAGTSPVDKIEGSDKIAVIPLPLAYVPHRFAAALPKTIRLLKAHIMIADYLHFAIGGLWGDWAGVACLISQQLRLPHAVWVDRVESRVVEFQSKSKVGLRKLYTFAAAKVMARYERFLIGHATLGLFNGMECYEAYAKYCSNSHVVHDIHLTATARISDYDLDERLLRPRPPLRLVYAGRVHLDKGVFDWIEALRIAAQDNGDFTAVWYGAGPELETARARVRELHLGSKIAFPGALEQLEVLRQLRVCDAFVYCHKTPESPRCLIEALMCGLPILGYDSSYPRDLLRNGGGILTPINDPAAIARSVSAIRNNALLAGLSRRALADGRRFGDEEAFRHRSALMQTIRKGARS